MMKKKLLKLCLRYKYYKKTFGCASAIASSSYATELIKGMSIDEAANIKNSGILIFIRYCKVSKASTSKITLQYVGRRCN